MRRRTWLIWMVLVGLLAVSSLVGATRPPAAVDAQIRATRPRPASSYLHGPFVAVHVAFGLRTIQHNRIVGGVVHLTLRYPPAIRRLVTAINSIPGLGGFSQVSYRLYGRRREDGDIVVGTPVG